VFVPELVVKTAARRAGWPDALDSERYFNQVCGIVVELRRLIAGEEVEVPAWVSLNGDVGEGFRIETQLGALTVAPGSLVARASRAPAPGLMLTTTYPLSLDFDASPMDGQPSAGVFTSQREFQRRIDHVRLAFLLALDSSDPLALQVASREISNPLSWSSLSWPLNAPAFPLSLEERDAALVKSWCDTIALHHDPLIELAGRRALSAATPGRDAEDRLVDSVIGLDNLVGQGAGMKPARAFKEVVGALLTDDPVHQRAVSAKAKALYDARSEIVHGQRQLDVMEAEKLRRESLELLLGGLRRLFRELPALISDRRRARRLLREVQHKDRSSGKRR
jgi:DNA-binding transcriptional ArsR family regulator